MARIPVVGGTYESRSVAVDAQRTINFYPELVESGLGKARIVLYPTPGLEVFGRLPVGPVRGLFMDNERVYAVGGGVLYEVFRDGTSNRLGDLANDGRQASMRTNGHEGNQLLVVSGGHGYIYDMGTGVYTELTEAVGFPVGQAVNGTFLDGYFIVATETSFQVSNLWQGLNWRDPSGVKEEAVRSMGADGIVVAFQNHRELWVWGEVTSEVWYDSGANFPFTPIGGVFVEMGCAAKNSPQRFDNQVIWLAQNRDGDRICMMATQYVPQRVSTHACEVAWRRYSRVDDATSFCYQDDGHNFYVLTFPTAEATWVYDAATKLWHERAFWDTTTAQWKAHRAGTHCQAFGKHIVGDRTDGTLYHLNPGYARDGDAAIRRLRRTLHISKENKRLFFQRLELEMETGLAPMPPHTAPQTDPPYVMLRWSDDRAHTWSAEQWQSAGRIGHYMARVDWHRLGSSRDRVFEVTMTSDIPWRLTDGYVTIAEGAH